MAKTTPTVSKGISIFESWCSRRIKTARMMESSAKSYMQRLALLASKLPPGKSLMDLDHSWARNYEAQRLMQGCKPATVNRDLAAVKRMLAICVREELIPRNPMQGYELLPEKNERDRHLTKGEIMRLLEASKRPGRPAHLYPILMVALHTGLRKSGCLTLRWDDIQDGEIVKRVKGDRLVRIPMTESLKLVLAEWKETQPHPSGWVFPNPTSWGKRPMRVTADLGLGMACAMAGLEDLRFHDLRHTFATLFLEQFPDRIETLRVLMGHSGTYMTRRYAHVTDKSRHEAMAAFTV